MRQIVLDTETTGLEPEAGHRVIEIGALEMIERRLTGRQFHYYLNPERSVESGALEVHGLTDDFLADKPRFADIAGELVEFIRDAELVIHNAAFDVGFLDAEFERLDEGPRVADICTVLDTLMLARDLHPGQRNSLDALCKRYEVDNANRTLHGALLDSEILAEVYLTMTGGQTDLELALGSDTAAHTGPGVGELDLSALVVQEPDDEERAAHQARLEAIRESSGECLWLELEAESD